MDAVHNIFSRALSRFEMKLWHERGPLQHKQWDCHTLRARTPAVGTEHVEQQYFVRTYVLRERPLFLLISILSQ